VNVAAQQPVILYRSRKIARGEAKVDHSVSSSSTENRIGKEQAIGEQRSALNEVPLQLAPHRGEEQQS
jgi:hypothetical protein